MYLLLFENYPSLGKNLLHIYDLKSFNQLVYTSERKLFPLLKFFPALKQCPCPAAHVHRLGTQWPVDVGPEMWTSVAVGPEGSSPEWTFSVVC